MLFAWEVGGTRPARGDRVGLRLSGRNPHAMHPSLRPTLPECAPISGNVGAQRLSFLGGVTGGVSGVVGGHSGDERAHPRTCPWARIPTRTALLPLLADQALAMAPPAPTHSHLHPQPHHACVARAPPRLHHRDPLVLLHLGLDPSGTAARHACKQIWFPSAGNQVSSTREQIGLAAGWAAASSAACTPTHLK